MLGDITKKILAELKDHPLVLVMLVVLIGWAWYSDLTHAKQADMVLHLQSDSAAFTSINVQYKSLMVVTVATAIQSTWVTWCSSQNGSRISLNNNLNNLQRDYSDLTGRDYDLPECEDIVGYE